MSNTKKIVCIILAFSVIFGTFAGYSSASAKSINGLKILTLPDKTEFVKGNDWIYGLWDLSESGSGVISVPSSKISFTHNPCGGSYPERGMIDMTGLSIEISYSDGTTSVVKYTESIGKSGSVRSNILASPKSGKEFFVGENIIEVYLSEAPKYYDSYTIKIVESSQEKSIVKLSSKTAVIDSNSGYITVSQSGLTKKLLENEIFDFGDAEATFDKAGKTFRFYGTGSTVSVKYPDGTADNFTIILPGDIDGNGIINYDDVGIANKATMDNSILTKEQKAAADIDKMSKITVNDVSLIIKLIEN